MTHARAGDDMVRRLQAALTLTFEDPALAAACEDLLLAGHRDPRLLAAYDRIRAFERYATRRGYPALA